MESEQNLGRDPSLLYTPAELAKWEAGTEKGYKSYDYYKEVLRPNVPQYYISANASGGSQRASYYMSISRLKQEAVIKDYSFERTNLQANMETSLAKGLKVGTQISARLEKRHNVVDQVNNQGSVTVNTADIPDQSQPVTIKMNIPAGLATQSYFFARVGVKTAGVAESIYSVPVKIE